MRSMTPFSARPIIRICALSSPIPPRQESSTSRPAGWTTAPPQGSRPSSHGCCGNATRPDCRGTSFFPVSSLRTTAGRCGTAYCATPGTGGWRRAFPLAGGGERLLQHFGGPHCYRLFPGAGRAVAEATGLEDKLLDVAEPFAQWIIEAPEWVQGEFPAEQARSARALCGRSPPLPGAEGAHSQRGPHCPDPGGPPLRAHAGAHLHGGPGAEELPGWGAVSGDYPHTLPPPGGVRGLRPGGGGAV